MSQDAFKYVLASAVADAGTFVVGYPTNRDAGNYQFGADHYLSSWKYGVMRHGGTVSFSFGATGATITNNTGETLEAGTELYVNFSMSGEVGHEIGVANVATMDDVPIVRMSLGAPDTADVDGLIAAFTGTAATIALDGALVGADGVGVFDVPRNIVVDSGGADTTVLTFTGRDEYGQTMVESITVNGATAVGGKKAFKYVDSVSASLDAANGVFAGPGDILGLPAYLPGVGHVLREMQDGAVATAGTVVAGVRTAATATTGDVRGTYDPNSAANGALMFTLIAAIPDPMDRGVAQFAG